MKETCSHITKATNSPITGSRKSYRVSGEVDYLIIRATQCVGINLVLKNKWEFTLEPTSAYSKPYDLKFARFNFYKSSPFVAGNVGMRFGVGMRF